MTSSESQEYQAVRGHQGCRQGRGVGRFRFVLYYLKLSEPTCALVVMCEHVICTPSMHCVVALVSGVEPCPIWLAPPS